MQLNKATLEPAKDEKAKKIEFMFNPNELKFSRSINTEQSQGSRTKSGGNKNSFKHPNPYQLTISNIILDTYEKKKGRSQRLETAKRLYRCNGLFQIGERKRQATTHLFICLGH